MVWIAASAILAMASAEADTKADISDYFLRDPYDQLDLFRQSTLSLQKQDSKAETETEQDPDDLYDEYYDYLYDVGAMPKRESTTASTTTSTTTTTSPSRLPESSRLRPRKGPLTVADDVLGRVKKPKHSAHKKRYNYKNLIRDNIAAEMSPIKRMSRPPRIQKKKSRPAPQKLAQRKAAEAAGASLPGLENVERLIPSSLKTVIEDSGRRIVKAVMQPINNIPRNTQIRETTFSSKMETWLQPYRTYFGYMAPTFAPANITSFLVTQWVSTISITVAWVFVGFMYQTMIGGRSFEQGRSMQPWEDLVPDSGTMSVVLQDLADAAARWHDEL